LSFLPWGLEAAAPSERFSPVSTAKSEVNYLGYWLRERLCGIQIEAEPNLRLPGLIPHFPLRHTVERPFWKIAVWGL